MVAVRTGSARLEGGNRSLSNEKDLKIRVIREWRACGERPARGRHSAGECKFRMAALPQRNLGDSDVSQLLGFEAQRLRDTKPERFPPFGLGYAAG
jgi:hypothetical protein